MKSAIPLTVLAAAVGAQASSSGPQPSSFRDALKHSIMSDMTNDVAGSSAVAAPQGTPQPSAGSHHSPPIYPHHGEGGAPHGGAGRGPPSHPPMAQAERRAFRPDGQGVDEGNTVTSASDSDDDEEEKEPKEHKPMGDSTPTCSTLTEVKTVTQTVTGSPHHSSASHGPNAAVTSSAVHSPNLLAETPGSSTHAYMQQAASPSSTHAVHSQLISNQASTSAVAHGAMVSSSGVVMGPSSAYSVIPVHVPMASSSHSSIKLHGSNSAATPSASAGPSGADPNRAHGTMAATPSSMSFEGAGAQLAPNAAILTAFGGLMGIVAFVL